MYLEFIILIFDYFNTLTKRLFIFEWLFPFILTTLIFILNTKLEIISYLSFKENTINILGVLLGFSIAIITILTTGSSKNLEKIKNIKTEIILNNTFISLYDLLLINFTYSVILEIFIIISCLIFPVISSVIYFSIRIKVLFYSILILLVLHVLLLTLRNLTDFYLIIRK